MTVISQKTNKMLSEELLENLHIKKRTLYALYLIRKKYGNENFGS